MMKKLLVLSLVLGIASLATAGLTISGYDGRDLMPSDTIILTVEVSDIAASDYTYFAVFATEGGSVSKGQNGPGAGNIGGMLGGSTLAFYPVEGSGIDSNLSDSTGAVLNGTALTFEFHCDGPVPGVIELWVTDFANPEMVDMIQISQVPEPATMALLGLGALVLRRKK
jgi:hypothetical protein